MLNSLSQFWQELKRRKVVRVVTVYAASAFVILELVDILAPSLRLPDWTLNLVLILLIVGFIIAVILSWIYDIHPEGGIVKTESVKKIKTEDIPVSSNSWKIASYISFVVIVGLIILNIIPRSGKNEILDKSIAVLPFKNDSPDLENEYFCNGMMETILNQLVKIGDLKVMSRTEVEPYRNTTKTRKEIAGELGVANFLEGSVYKMGNRFRISVQLINSKSGFHLWSDEYEGEYTEEIFALQSNIARQVALALKAVITQEEEKSIERKPTENIEAYDLVLKGWEMTDNYWKTLDSKYNQLAHNLLNLCRSYN
jgi:TolB-like protein